MNIPASSTGSVQRAVMEALAYSDIFEHSLRLNELHRYLPLRADLQEVSAALTALQGLVDTQDDLYFLAGREEIVEIRRGRETRSKKLLPLAVRWGKILGSLPFVRMVALTGSLAVLNLSKNSDFDYMLVAAKGRVWTARLFAVALGRFAKLFGHTLCPNLIVSETALEWPLHDLYSARELVQMIPITGMDVYRTMMEVNVWAGELLPNAHRESTGVAPKARQLASVFQSLLEVLLRDKHGDRFEQWEMTRKISRFSILPGFGDETVFNAEVCQGNFHHHRKWTREVFEEKLAALAAVPGGELMKYPSPRTATEAHIA